MRSSKSSNKPKPDILLQVVHEWSFEAIGTTWWVGLYELTETVAFHAVQQTIAELIEQFDKTYSRFRADSRVSEIAKTAGTFSLPADSEALFALYRKLYDVTDGAVTPLVGQLLADAGYDARYSLRPGALVSPPDWDAVMRYEHGVLTTQRPILLDFGAAGKGYLVDLVVAKLQAAGFEKLCVDAGGDMRCVGLPSSLQIGLENPDDTSQAIGVAALQNGALCGSAGNRRAWAGYHHIISPFTLESPREIKAVWVTAEDALTADGLTTALFFAEPNKLREVFTFEYAMVYADTTVAASPDFPAQLFTNKDLKT